MSEAKYWNMPDFRNFAWVQTRNSAISTLDEDTKTRQRARTWNISNRRHENLKDVIFVPSTVNISLFHLAYFVLSCFRTNYPKLVGSLFQNSLEKSWKNKQEMLDILYHTWLLLYITNITNTFYASIKQYLTKIFIKKIRKYKNNLNNIHLIINISPLHILHIQIIVHDCYRLSK